MESKWYFPVPIVLNAETTALSHEGKQLATFWRKVQERRTRESSIADSLRRLDVIAAGANTPDWDGYGGRPVDLISKERASMFIRMFPEGLEVPDVSVDPDGEVSLEWHRGPGYAYSISFAPTGAVSHAGLFGRSSGYGVETIGDGIPDAILENLRRVLVVAPQD